MKQTHLIKRPLGPAIRVTAAHSWLKRLKGLLGTRSLAQHHGLWLKPCKGIHTVGMLYRIDVVFLNQHYRITKVDNSVPPFWFSMAPRDTTSVLELARGGAELHQLTVGETLELCKTTAS